MNVQLKLSVLSEGADFFMTEELYEATLIERHSAPVQEKLKNAHVAICGLGGLGSNIAVMLSRIGVGHLHLIDFDVVEPSNLNRQQYFIRHIGMPKTEALPDLLKEINPYIEIKTDNVKLTEDNCLSYLQNEKIICEAFDKPEAKAMLVETVLSNCADKIVVAASGMAGYGESNSIKTKKINEKFYLCGDEVTGIREGFGLMAPRVTICAAHEANLVVQLIMENY